MYPTFITIAGAAIAAHRIDYINFRNDGIATIHIGANSIVTEDQTEVDKLKELFASDGPQSDDEPLPTDPAATE